MDKRHIPCSLKWILILCLMLVAGSVFAIVSRKMAKGDWPECASKICWSTSQDPVERYDKMQSFFRRNGFADEAAFAAKSASSIRSKQGYGLGPGKK